jgi:hypothetical protein
MLLRLCLLLALVASGSALAQNKVRTESIKPSPAAPGEPASPQKGAAGSDKAKGRLAPLAAAPEIITDLSRLPAPVARTRERILVAARSGELQKLATLMNETMPIFSFSNEKDPIALWKATYPDSDGIEVLSILTTILETGFVRVDGDTPQEMFVWPYFVRISLKAITPPQKAELFRIITGADYKDMTAFGAYAFYRLGIGPDGRWHFFVAGD